MSDRDHINQAWIGRWADGRTGWHMQNVNPYLQKHFNQLCSPSDAGKRIIVPLCGATHDLKFFYDHGLSVVGIEISESAIKKFFEDHNLNYNILDLPSAGAVMYSHNEKLKICQVDLFKSTLDMLGGQFDFWWDIGGLVAMDPSEQHKYINQLDSLLSPTANCLMEVFEYDPSKRSGPPRSVFPDHLRELLADRYHIEEISRLTEDKLEDDHTARIGFDALHVLYLLKKK